MANLAARNCFAASESSEYAVLRLLAYSDVDDSTLLASSVDKKSEELTSCHSLPICSDLLVKSLSAAEKLSAVLDDSDSDSLKLIVADPNLLAKSDSLNTCDALANAWPLLDRSLMP